MDILSKIFNWIQSQPDWQSDAFRRIWENGELSDDDIGEISTLVKSSCGIHTGKNLTAQLFKPPDSGGAEARSISLRLRAIRELQNVNALAEKQELSFNPNGLTIIYGENGAGKSGYSRVLKRACYARAQGGKILPDAFAQGGSQSPASAKFVWQVGLGAESQTRDMIWVDGESVPEGFGPLMSSVAVFDSQCARIYAADKGRTVDYQPYGLDLLRMLGSMCKDRLGKRFQEESAIVCRGLGELQRIVAKSERYGEFVQAVVSGKINSESGIAKAQKFPAFTAGNQQLLEVLEKDPKGRDAGKMSRELREKLGRITDLKNKISVLTKVDGEILSCLPDVIKSAAVAEETIRTRAENLPSDGLLPGTVKEEAWKKLYLAAREFSTIAYSFPDSRQGPIFPEDGPDPRCVLCQQPLMSEGKDNLKRFDKFMRDRSEKNLLEKQAAIENVRGKLNQLLSDLKQLLPSAFLFEIRTLSERAGGTFPGLLKSVEKHVVALRSRAEIFMESLDGRKWKAPPSLPDNPSHAIEEFLDWIEHQISEYDHAAVNQESINVQIVDLRAAKAFAEHRATVINLIRLEMCRKAVNTRKISAFEKSLSDEEVNQKLAKRLNEEIEFLGGAGAGKDITFHVTHREGGSKIQLMLPRLVADCSPSDVLSEGQQNAIAMASFFSEISLSDKVSTLVFDDPALSIDDRRLEWIAERLINAAKQKQIIVFTHDLYFANLLGEDKGAWEIGLSESEDGEIFGIVGKMPFTGMRIGQKISDLEKRGRDLKNTALGNEQVQKELKSAYSDLRDAIEHLTEHKFLHKVVTRRSPNVKVGNLSRIFAKPQEKADIAAMIDRLHGRVSDRLHRSERRPKLYLPDFQRDVDALKEIRARLNPSGKSSEANDE